MKLRFDDCPEHTEITGHIRNDDVDTTGTIADVGTVISRAALGDILSYANQHESLLSACREAFGVIDALTSVVEEFGSDEAEPLCNLAFKVMAKLQLASENAREVAP